MKKNILLVSIVLIFLSCTLYIPTPDFTITFIDPLGNTVDSTTTEVLVKTISIENNTSYAVILDRISYDYIYNGTVIYDGQDLWNIYVLVPPTTTDKTSGEKTIGKGTIENISIPFPGEVYNYMETRNIQGVTLRIYVSGTDNVNKSKRSTEYVDYGVARY